MVASPPQPIAEHDDVARPAFVIGWDEGPAQLRRDAEQGEEPHGTHRHDLFGLTIAGQCDVIAGVRSDLCKEVTSAAPALEVNDGHGRDSPAASGLLNAHHTD